MGTDSQFGTIKKSSAGVGCTIMLVYFFFFFFLIFLAMPQWLAGSWFLNQGLNSVDCQGISSVNVLMLLSYKLKMVKIVNFVLFILLQ